MNFPAFYNEIPSIKFFEPLSDVLGSSSNGVVEFSFKDAVKIAGHGCPTVGGAYLMVFYGIKKLYGDEVPVRGNIEIHISDPIDSGSTGVVGMVAGSIVGAAEKGGFKGLGGQFSRNNSLFFNASFDGDMKLRRKDNGQTVIMEYHPEIVSGNPEMGIYLKKVLDKTASEDEKALFQKMWNDRLKKIMVDEFNNSKLVLIK
jgi:hypothetical protein